MDIEQIAVWLQKTDDRSLRNEGRIKKLENEHEVLHDMAKSLAVMAEKQSTMGESVDRLERKVDTLEAKPGKRGDSLVDKLLFTVAGAFLAWVAAGMPGM